MFDLSCLVVLIGAYAVGALPTGYLFAYAGGVKDIRNHGSGNIGATNVARVLGAHYFAPIFIIDAVKAAVYISLVAAYGYQESVVLACALALLVGNGYSLFLQFTGGKGFATTVGIMCILAPGLTMLLSCLWVVVLLVTRTVGIASAITCLSLVVSGFYFLPTHEPLSYAFFAIGGWGIWRHADNIKRYVQLPID